MIPPTARPTRITLTTLREWRAHSDAVQVLDVRTPPTPGRARRRAEPDMVTLTVALAVGA